MQIILCVCVPFFQALHRISLRETVCTVRVCEVLLTLTSTLIDLGVLANSTKALLSSLVKEDSDKEATPPENDTNMDQPSQKKDPTNPAGTTAASEANVKSPAGSSTSASIATFTLHNTFMDIVIR